MPIVTAEAPALGTIGPMFDGRRLTACDARRQIWQRVQEPYLLAPGWIKAHSIFRYPLFNQWLWTEPDQDIGWLWCTSREGEFDYVTPFGYYQPVFSWAEVARR